MIFITLISNNLLRLYQFMGVMFSFWGYKFNFIETIKDKLKFEKFKLFFNFPKFLLKPLNPIIFKNYISPPNI